MFDTLRNYCRVRHKAIVLKCPKIDDNFVIATGAIITKN
jgi:acetyltransferase-like isoleucine patch superfamily enzyme